MRELHENNLMSNHITQAWIKSGRNLQKTLCGRSLARQFCLLKVYVTFVIVAK